MIDVDEHKPELHAMSVANIANLENARFGKMSFKARKEAEKAFQDALKAHEKVFGLPIKKNGVWQ